MKLMTKAIEKKLPAIGSTENIPAEQKKVICKFFAPITPWSWYVVEGKRRGNGDFLFFGYVEGQEGEFGYFSLSELQEVRGMFGLGVERDLHLPKDLTLGDVMK